MSSLNSLRSDLNNYQNFRANMQDLSTKVTQAEESLDSAINKIGSCYEIDDISADVNNISDCKNCLSNQRDFIVQNIIPSIDSKIDEIKKEIEELESEEEEQSALSKKD